MSVEYNYQNTLRFFHFHANIEFPKQMERQLLRLILQTRFRKEFWRLYSVDVQREPAIELTGVFLLPFYKKPY